MFSGGQFGLDEVADIDDVVVLQAVRRTHRQFQFVHLLEERGVELQLRGALFADFLAGLFEVHEDRELVLQDAGGERHGVLGNDRAIGLDLHGQLIIVENLAFARVGHTVGDLLHRAVEAVHRDEADGGVFRTVALRRDIALAERGGEFHADRGALVERADHMIRVENLHIRAGLDIARGGNAGAFLLQHHALGAIRMDAQRDFLDVQNDVGDVLAHTRDGGEFMQYAIDVNRVHGGALQGGQEHTAQRVPERQAEAALQGLRDNRTEALGIPPR
jgi:hypothetical protein